MRFGKDVQIPILDFSTFQPLLSMRFSYEIKSPIDNYQTRIKKTKKNPVCWWQDLNVPGSDDVMLLQVITLDVYVLLLLWAGFMPILVT